MRAVRSYVLILAAVVIASSCFDKKIPPNLPPADVAAYKAVYSAITIEKALGRAQAAVIQASGAGAIADSFSIPFVKFTRAASITVAAIPEGWRATIAKAWEETKNSLSAADKAKYDGYILSIDALLGSIGGSLESDTGGRISEVHPAVPARLHSRAARADRAAPDAGRADLAARDDRGAERGRRGRVLEDARDLPLAA